MVSGICANYNKKGLKSNPVFDAGRGREILDFILKSGSAGETLFLIFSLSAHSQAP
jgi:hypothetical protein